VLLHTPTVPLTRGDREPAEQGTRIADAAGPTTGRAWADAAGEFEVAMQHLGAALDELHIPKTEQDELAGLLRPMRDDIVEVESPETGTPLPDSYQAAPP
jgi:hypothetical protein